MPRYADILLPLATPAFTYTLPPELAPRVAERCRVMVELGRGKTYAGLVVRLHDEAPAPGVRLKPVLDVLDESPVVRAEGLAFWFWMADYYLSTPGEVMKAALPAGLRLAGETVVAPAAGWDGAAALTPRQRRVLGALPAGGGLTVGALEKTLGERRLLPVVRRLMELGAVVCDERLRETVRPRTETCLRLSAEAFDEGRLHAFLDGQRAGSRQAGALLAYLDEAGAAEALRLGRRDALRPVTRAALTGRGVSDSALRALTAKGLVETFTREVDRVRPRAGLAPASRHALSPRQAEALRGVRAALAGKDCCLLHGVTGSGKTEIYIRLIEETLAAGRQALLMLPEIALTTQITERLAGVFGARMGVYHSRFPDAERMEIWRRMLGPEAYPLVVGVRSSVFLPFANLGLVIVDEEHETSYKQQDPAPRYHARDAVAVLARRYGAKVVLGTATPSVETYARALGGRIGLVELAERHAGAELPEIVVEDVARLRFTRRMKTAFAPRLVDEVRRALSEGGQAILFQNRRGYAPVLACRACGWTPRCAHCDVSLTYHERAARLVCHYCGKSYEVPRQCPCCGGGELRDAGYGTEKIEDLAAETFPGARILRMDLDTTRSRHAHERLIDDFAAGRADILVGTQMVTKGLDFDRVRVVGILSADQMLSQPDFRAHERAYQMMSQVAGRAGRKGRRGLVVLQTAQADLPVVGQVVRGDYRAMFDDQMAERRAFLFPPVCRLIRIDVRHADERRAEAAARRMADLLRPHFADRLLGPDRPAVGRTHSLHIRRLLLKVDPALPAAGVRRTLRAARDLVLAGAEGRGVSLIFDVDPC